MSLSYFYDGSAIFQNIQIYFDGVLFSNILIDIIKFKVGKERTVLLCCNFHVMIYRLL